MKCRTCGGAMETKSTDLPFKVGESAIVIIKDPPVVQCPQCSEYVISDRVMMSVEHILASINKGAVLEIVRYTARADLRWEMTEDSLSRAVQFSWEKTALETLKIYEQVIRAYCDLLLTANHRDCHERIEQMSAAGFFFDFIAGNGV